MNSKICTVRDEIDCAWQCLCLALQAAGWFRTQVASLSAANNDVSRMWEYPLLQGVIEFGEEQLYFEKVLQESTAADLTWLDPLGRTALAVAMEVAENMDQDSYSMQLCVVLKMLLDDQHGGSSALASLPIAGGLPLHQALKLGLQNGIVDLATAFPDALSIPDPTTHLLPCLLSAVGNGARVETIFALMIQRPNLIAELCQTN